MPTNSAALITDERPIRTAIVGYGLAGAVFHAPLIAATPGMLVCGIVTGNPARQAAARRAYPDAAIVSTTEELWQRAAEFDLVVVASPNRSHVELALAAIDAGLPVVVDKPLAPSVADAQRVIAAAEERQIPLTVFQNRRWDGDFRTVQALIARDLLGPVVRYESRFERYRPVPREGAWRERGEPEEAGGLLFDLGSHLIDQAAVLFGEPQSVYAQIARRRAGVAVDDDTFVALQFAGEVQAHLWMNVVVRIPGPRLYVSGLRGSYTKYGLDPQEARLREGARPDGADWGQEPPEAWGRLSTDVDGLHFDGSIETLPGQYPAFYAQLTGALRGEGPLPVDPRDALRTLRVIEAAQKSAAARQIVAL